MCKKRLSIVLMNALLFSGCQWGKTGCDVNLCSLADDLAPAACAPVATEIEYPRVQKCSYDAVAETPRPFTVDDGPPTEFWDLSLEEVIAIALRENDVLKDLGGRVLTAPEAVPTIYDPAIRESDPRFGPEAALSAFDAQWSTSAFWQNNDRVFNNRAELGVNQFQQDLATFQNGISKLTATGTQFSILNFTRYDFNNASTTNFFPGAWDTWYELNVRQPLLQGAGVTFNRIAGPNAQPGFNFTTGVSIARIQTDVSLADFEAGVINFVSQLEDAYWQLYFAYRELDSAMLARDSALDTWRGVEAKYQQKLSGGEAFKEARARAQYFFFQDRVQDVLNGTPTSIGMYNAERRLRTLMGLPPNEGSFMRPSEEPPLAKVLFDWNEILNESLTRRVELRKQKWQIKRRELELVAARNFTLPRLDATATYRLRGFGDDLTGGTTPVAGAGNFASAFKNLGRWEHQEWEGGVQLDVPLGFRQGWAAVRNAELQLARQRAILREQEREVGLELSDAFAEMIRAHAAVGVGFNRLNAAQQDREATQAAYDADQASVELLLESQQRLADAQSTYYRSLTDYSLAIKNVHSQKGSLLTYGGVTLAEGPWPHRAYHDAAELQRRWRPALLRPFSKIKPGVVSCGPFAQHLPPVEVEYPADFSDELPLDGDLPRPSALESEGAERVPFDDTISPLPATEE